MEHKLVPAASAALTRRQIEEWRKTLKDCFPWAHPNLNKLCDMALRYRDVLEQEPVAWCLAYDDLNFGRIHSNPTMYKPEAESHVDRCEGRIKLVSLIVAPGGE